MTTIKRFILSISFILCLFMTACASGNETGNALSPPPTSSANSVSPSPTSPEKQWEEVTRAYRVQGVLSGVAVEDSKFQSVSLKVTQNRPQSDNPIDYDLVGKTLDIYFQNVSASDPGIDQLKEGVELVITFADFARPQGDVVHGALPEWIYIVKNGTYTNLQGKQVTEDQWEP